MIGDTWYPIASMRILKYFLVRKAWLKANLKDIIHLINIQTFLMDEPEKGDPVKPCMDVYNKKS